MAVKKTTSTSRAAAKIANAIKAEPAKAAKTAAKAVKEEEKTAVKAAGQHQRQMAVAERRRGHAGGHGLHGGQRGLGLQKHAPHPQGRIPRGAHRVRDVQAQTAVQRPAVGIAQLCGVVDHRPGKTRVLQGVQPRGGLLLEPAEHDPRQLQQCFPPPSLPEAEYEDYWKAVFDTIEEYDAAGGLFWEFNDRKLSEFTVMDGDPILTY